MFIKITRYMYVLLLFTSGTFRSTWSCLFTFHRTNMALAARFTYPHVLAKCVANTPNTQTHVMENMYMQGDVLVKGRCLSNL